MKTTTFTTAALTCLFHALPSYTQTCSTQANVEVTYFGYPDNSPPGPGISFSCGRRGLIAGGNGTYGDPVTFSAAAGGDFQDCEIIYLPYVQKYARYEKDCDQCKTDWDKNQKTHIALWLGSNSFSGGDALINCEKNLATDGLQTIVRHPGPHLEVDGALPTSVPTSSSPAVCYASPTSPVPAASPALPCIGTVYSIVTVIQEPTLPATTLPATTLPATKLPATTLLTTTPATTPQSLDTTSLSESPQAAATTSLSTDESPQAPKNKPPTITISYPAQSPPPESSAAVTSSAPVSGEKCTWTGHCKAMNTIASTVHVRPLARNPPAHGKVIVKK
ncbi:hypothetical protein MMC22_009613 [Lobaria immixta]|nr:hypothetical protein [Lobaria immixta]